MTHSRRKRERRAAIGRSSALLGVLLGLTLTLVPAKPSSADHVPAFTTADHRVNEDVGAVLITVERSDTKGAVSADYATADGTASAGADYTPAKGTLRFADGERTKTFTVAVLDDGLAEGDETVLLRLNARLEDEAGAGRADGVHGGVPQAESSAVLTIVGNDGGTAGSGAAAPAPGPAAAGGAGSVTATTVASSGVVAEPSPDDTGSADATSDAAGLAGTTRRHGDAGEGTPAWAVVVALVALGGVAAAGWKVAAARRAPSRIS